MTIRHDRTLLLNGRPFFPNGLYYAHDEIADLAGAGLRALHDMGFNVIAFDGDLESVDALDRIHRAGLYVWYRPPGQLSGAYEQLKAIVKRVGQHPALLFWEVDDEPVMNKASIERTAAGVALVRAIDPFHPVLANQWMNSLAEEPQMRKWGELASVYGFSSYPIPLSRWGARMQLVQDGWPHSVAVVGTQTRAWRSYAPGKPIIPVLQAWAWNCLEDGDAAYPTFHQARFMAYHAVIHGANGLHHYGAVTVSRPNLACGIPPAINDDLERTHADFEEAVRRNRSFWAYYSKVVREISDMSRVFTSPDSDMQLKSTHPAIECLVKRHEDRDIALIVNASSEPAPLALPGIAGETIEPFGVRVHAVVTP